MKLYFLLFIILFISTVVLSICSIKLKSKRYFVYTRISFFLMIIVFVILMFNLKKGLT